MNNQASIKKKRKKGKTKKKKAQRINSKKTKKIIKGGAAADVWKTIKKTVTKKETFETIGNKIIKKIEKQETYLGKIETKKKEHIYFIKYKKDVNKIINNKNENIDTIIEKCLSIEHDKNENNKEYYKSLKILFDRIYNTDRSDGHRFHRKYRQHSIGRNRKKKNIFKYYSKALFFRIGKMRRYEYYINKNLVKIILLQLESERLIKKFNLMKTKIDVKQSIEYETLKGNIESKTESFKKNYGDNFNNASYKEFKNETGNYYLSLLRTSLETVSLKQNFDWKDSLRNIFRTPKDKKNRKDNRRDILEKLNQAFYKEIKDKTNNLLLCTNNLIKKKDESFSQSASDDENYKNYKNFHTIQYLNSKAFVKDMYIFKSVYMFNDEVSISMLDLGQLSMIDNSVLYYYNINNEKKRFERKIMRFELSNDYKNGIEHAINKQKIISLKYLYNLTSLPSFALKHLSLYFENFVKLKENTQNIINSFENDITKMLYYIKKEDKKEDKNRADIEKNRMVKESIDNLIKYSESTSKKMTEEIISEIKAKINKSIQNITLTDLDIGDGLSDLSNDLEKNIRKDVKIEDEFKFITMSTLKAMIHLYDYDIKNLYLDNIRFGIVKKGEYIPGKYYKWNWHENKSVSAFLNIMPKFKQSGQKKKNYLAFKTIKYIYIKIIYLLYFLFDIKNYKEYVNPIDNFFVKDKFENEVFKPTLFFYISLLIPENSKIDPFVEKKDKDMKLVEDTTLDIEKETKKEQTNKNKSKANMKLKLKFLEEFGIVHNLISEEVPLGIIYNMIGEYLNELWSLLFDLEKTILYLQSTDDKFKKYSVEENFSIIQFNKKTYPKIWNDLDMDKEDLDDEDGKLKGDERNVKIDGKNKDTHSIYNFSYKSNILYNKQDNNHKYNDNSEDIKKEDEYYKNILNQISNVDFSSTFMTKFKTHFYYYFTKENNQSQKQGFDDFCENLTTNIDNIIKYLRKYFKITNIGLDIEINSTSSSRGNKEQMLSDIKILTNLSRFMSDNSNIISNITVIRNMFDDIIKFFQNFNNINTSILTASKEELKELCPGFNEKNYYLFLINDLKSLISKIDNDKVGDFETIFKEVINNGVFSNLDIQKKFNNAFTDSIMSKESSENNNFLNSLAHKLELNSLQTKLNTIQETYKKLYNYQLTKEDLEQKHIIEIQEVYDNNKKEIETYLIKISELNVLLKENEKNKDSTTVILKQIVNNLL